MKKFSTSIITLMLMLTLSGVGYASKPVNGSSPISTPIAADRPDVLILRLNEINAMDKSELSSLEKKGLRKEVKSIRKTLSGNGVYISAGGVIIILLLLILLL